MIKKKEHNCWMCCQMPFKVTEIICLKKTSKPQTKQKDHNKLRLLTPSDHTLCKNVLQKFLPVVQGTEPTKNTKASPQTHLPQLYIYFYWWDNDLKYFRSISKKFALYSWKKISSEEQALLYSWEKTLTDFDSLICSCFWSYACVWILIENVF